MSTDLAAETAIAESSVTGQESATASEPDAADDHTPVEPPDAPGDALAFSSQDATGSEVATKAAGKRASKREKKAAAKLNIKQLATKTRKESKKRKREKKIESFKDYFNYQEPLSKIPPHRLLAINRGDRSKILRVKIEADAEAMTAKAEQFAIPANHPHSEFLRGKLRDALNRLILPSLEREVRRELTERAELHAVQVFARNLRKLLLQPPVNSRRVLAIDPGFRSGCKLAALDEFGSVLGHTVIHVIGKEDVVRRGRQQIVEMITMYHIPIIAIGNGTACRETERLTADIIANELKHLDVQYIMVNEAGASVYSTSSVGREELPRFDPVLRSAVSIGRRLQDPLSELVKINPANIGVGLYQHDVKAKHLQDSLDAVVESCVNFVGVDVNTASPALLRYVSGLNQLTARRLYEFRQKHGPFRNRDQFKQVPGFGEATFVQSAGFLKILGGDNPLDATWIHPESYEIAQGVIEQLGGTVAELAAKVPTGRMTAAAPCSAMAQFARGVLADGHHEHRRVSADNAAPSGPDEVPQADTAPATELPPPFNATPTASPPLPSDTASETPTASSPLPPDTVSETPTASPSLPSDTASEAPTPSSPHPPDTASE
ncbi:MAG: helix-hairpin-helix domain-containing protein, partial [Planctomycetes bacterium]|nr:helix-hairpin-helix domain-containing protein [Planctomycetota bacterium]